jgi:hypothetical protein
MVCASPPAGGQHSNLKRGFTTGRYAPIESFLASANASRYDAKGILTKSIRMAFSPSMEPGSGPFSQSDYQTASRYQNEPKGFQSYVDQMPNESEYYEEPLKTVIRGERKSFKHWFCFLFSLILGIAWLAPIVYLLYLNITYSVIGAAAWCPGDSCGIISYFIGTNATRAEVSAKYDNDNHNLLGALQFAAKALEVWFVYIATSLLYLVTCFLAKRQGGMLKPVGRG